MRPLAGLAGLACVLTLLAGCGGDGEGGDGVDPVEATERLERQRDDVRASASSLLAGAERALPGRVATDVGRYDGCESLVPEGFASFRFTGQARVEVVPGASAADAPYLEPLRTVLEEAGYAVDGPRREPNGWRTLVGTTDGLTAAFTWTGAGEFVGLTVHGPCVDVPRDDWRSWLSRGSTTLR